MGDNAGMAHKLVVRRFVQIWNLPAYYQVGRCGGPRSDRSGFASAQFDVHDEVGRGEQSTDAAVYNYQLLRDPTAKAFASCDTPAPPPPPELSSAPSVASGD